MLKEQASQSPSVVCIHMNVDSKAQHRGRGKSCACHEFCNTHQHYVAPELSGKRKKRRKRSNRANTRSHYRSRSSGSASSASSNGVLWQSDIDNSKPKESESNSTSSALRGNKSTAQIPSILREDRPYSASRPKSRRRRSKKYSRGRHSRSGSRSGSSTDSGGESRRHRKSKHKRTSADSRSSSNVHRRKHNKPDKQLSRRSRKRRRSARSKSSLTSSRSPSRSYSSSDMSTGSLASTSTVDFRGTQLWRNDRNMVKKTHYENCCNTDSERKCQFVESNCPSTICNPELRTVELINTIGIANDGCTNLRSCRGQTTCMCGQCMNKQYTSPTCLVSRCFMTPSSNPDTTLTMLDSKCTEIPCYKNSCIRDDYFYRKPHRHESRRKRSSERRETRGHTRNNHEKKVVVDSHCLHSCNCTQCMTKTYPQFYQCSLHLGQTSQPFTSSQCALFPGDNSWNHT